ncbi:MAG: hypothetical protein WC761_03560 [Candidatus Paceibacterota bacterium]|jgi:hypothetical protein
MFHLNFKDYAFLLGIGLLLFVVGGGLLLSGNLQQQSDAPSEVVQNTGTFNCGGDRFGVDVPVDEFTFDPHFGERYPEFFTDCRWTSETYDIIYSKFLKASSDRESDTADYGNFMTGMKEGMINNPEGYVIEHRDIGPNIFEIKFFDRELNQYQIGRFIGSDTSFIGFTMHSPQDNISLDDPRFRAFVDSFRPLN